MSERDWHYLLARLSPQAPADLDAILNLPLHHAPLPDAAPAAQAPAPSARLWARPLPALPVIGIRVEAPLPDPAATAARLAAAALERDLTPVILSSLPVCGLEPFGFRIERIAAGSPDQRTTEEAELVRFWDMALVIDAAEIMLMA